MWNSIVSVPDHCLFISFHSSGYMDYMPCLSLRCLAMSSCRAFTPKYCILGQLIQQPCDMPTCSRKLQLAWMTGVAGVLAYKRT